MKILLSLRHPFGLRNFEPVVRQLARRGHTVRLSFLTGDKSDAVGLPQVLARETAEVSCSTLPTRKNEPWLGPTRRLRLLADALRYRLPMYDRAEKLRARAQRRLTPGQERLARLPMWRWPLANRLASRILSGLDASLPPGEIILAEVREQEPDLIVVSPLVDFGSEQVDYIKAGRLLGIPSALAVNSWDNLTNKGKVRLQPDRILVWNETQRDEAVQYHQARRQDVVVTGAPIYDRWFDRRPARSAEELKRRAGLDPARPYLLYLCSSPFIAGHELEFVERWLASVRGAASEELRGAGVLIRPHPENRQPWGRLEAAGWPGVSVWPPTGASPVGDEAATDYFDSIFHSRAVVGINSSGLIEAGIVGRPVLTVLDPELTATQEGTLHFHYLVNVGGGLLRVARSWPEHAEQLCESLAMSPQDASQASARFVREFVRPHGLQIAATPQLVESLIDLTATPASKPRPVGLGARLTRRLLARSAVRRDESGEGTLSQHGPRQVRDKDSIAQHIDRLAASDAERLILGPWLGDLSAEVTYWLPFLGWATQRLGRERLVAVSRGGVGTWYEGVAADYLEILDYFILAELRAGREDPDSPADVPRSMMPFDREVVRVLKQALGVRKVRALHPSVLAGLCRDYWNGGTPDTIVDHCHPTPLPPAETRTSEGELAVGLPVGGMTQTLGREQVIAALDALTSSASVVILGADFDTAASVKHPDRLRMRAYGGSASTAAGDLVEELASASAFVGMGSGHDLVAAQYGVPTLLMRRPEAGDLRHIERARAVAIRRGGAVIDVVAPDDPEVQGQLQRFAARASAPVAGDGV